MDRTKDYYARQNKAGSGTSGAYFLPYAAWRTKGRDEVVADYEEEEEV